MNTTTKQAIREALKALNDAQLTSQPSADYGKLLSGAHKAERILQSALALLDKSGEGEAVPSDLLDEMCTDPVGDYYTGLRCGVEDRNIMDRYEAAEYGWQQAFEYVGSIAESYRKSRPLDTDKYMEEVRGAGKALTDEQLQNIVSYHDRPNWSRTAALMSMAQYLRDNGYLSPSKAPEEGLSPVWSPAEDELDTPCWVTGCKCAIGPICKPDLYCARCGTPIDHSKVDVDRAPVSTNT